MACPEERERMHIKIGEEGGKWGEMHGIPTLTTVVAEESIFAEIAWCFTSLVVDMPFASASSPNH